MPLRGYAWGVYEVNMLWVDKPTIVCCFSAKWLGGAQITQALPDYLGYRVGKENDKKLIQEIWKLLDEADIIIGQNSDNFDLKMINTEFVKHKIQPPSPYKTVDTLKTARRMFRFPSNKLDDLGDQLNEGRKLEHEGKGLWKKCIEGDMGAWDKMKRYCAQDVRLLERVYTRFIPWTKTHPNLSAWNEKVCPKCGSNQMWKRGYNRTATGFYQRYQCVMCGGWMYEKKPIESFSSLKNL